MKNKARSVKINAKLIKIVKEKENVLNSDGVLEKVNAKNQLQNHNKIATLLKKKHAKKIPIVKVIEFVIQIRFVLEKQETVHKLKHNNKL